MDGRRERKIAECFKIKKGPKSHSTGFIAAIFSAHLASEIGA
jgi:hypothetical protein